MKTHLFPLVALFACLPSLFANAKDRLVFDPPSDNSNGKHVVLVSGDEEYRSEETMPMLGKLLSQRHGFKCTVLFALAADGSGYIDPNNQSGIVGFEALDDADLMIIGTRFRNPDEEDAKHITAFLNAGKPVIGIRTSTHAFRGDGSFGSLTYNDFGLKVLGETWVSHHGKHKQQGARSVINEDHSEHPILTGVEDIFCPSDVYGVIHLTEKDTVLMRAGVTETLDPESPFVDGEKNEPMQPFVWLHEYSRPDGSGTGKSLCTTGGASVDMVDKDLRRLVVNAAYYLTGQSVPEEANVKYVDPFYPSFFGFIRNAKGEDHFRDLDLRPEHMDLGKVPDVSPDPKGSPEWNHRPRPRETATSN